MIFRNIAILAAYFGVWATVHSTLASVRIKAWTQRVLHADLYHGYRLAFNAIAALTLLPFAALIILLPDRFLYLIPTPWRWLTIGLQVLAFCALAWTLLQTGVLRFAGLAQLVESEETEHPQLQIRGFYCHVRHPLYLFSAILLWLMPIMTLNIATANLLITLYFAIGSWFEEQKLLHEFGPDYAIYQNRVPRFLPRLRGCPPTPRERTKEN